MRCLIGCAALHAKFSPTLPSSSVPEPPRQNTVKRPSHPVPTGMRDWLPRQARRRAVVSDRILRSLELFGYQRVEVPPFEYADVLERGFANVEPETGKIAALRSDVTPQIARLVTTRFAEGPWPARLCYQASVMRRRHER